VKREDHVLLRDVWVLDATDRSGWMAGRILADLGAELLKVDPPGTDRSEPHWRALNVNKRVLDCDLNTEQGRAALEQVLGKADICLVSPGVFDGGGLLEPADLRRRFPRIVVVAITPFGQVGPRSHWKGSDIEVMAAGGAMALAGEPDGMPLRVGEPQASSWAGAQAAEGALAALLRREVTGSGDIVHVSAQACVIAAIAHAPAFHDLLSVEPQRAGLFITGRTTTGGRYRALWPCRDGWLSFILYGGAAGLRTNSQLVAWMREQGTELGRLANIDWEGFDLTRAEQPEIDALEAPVMKFFAGLTKRAFLDETHRRGMLGYPVSTVADIAADPQLEARAFFQSVAGERFCGSFLRIDGVRPTVRYAPGTPYRGDAS
jgi:crotonobetainyl-CoA:carnitine CoA-transferase CaiB-like acyl-CoA transferase